jgi:hypothetical protein
MLHTRRDLIALITLVSLNSCAFQQVTEMKYWGEECNIGFMKGTCFQYVKTDKGREGELLNCKGWGTFLFTGLDIAGKVAGAYFIGKGLGDSGDHNTTTFTSGSPRVNVSNTNGSITGGNNSSTANSSLSDSLNNSLTNNLNLHNIQNPPTNSGGGGNPGGGNPGGGNPGGGNPGGGNPGGGNPGGGNSNGGNSHDHDPGKHDHDSGNYNSKDPDNDGDIDGPGDI